MRSDEELVRQIQCGDEEAAEELVTRYYASILRYCSWHCSDHGKAEDLTQETFYRVFHSISGYQNHKKFKSYIYTIALHLCIDESRRPPMYSMEEGYEAAKECVYIRQVEDQMEITALMNCLTPVQRETVILYYGEQLSYREIALIMGCNLRTVQSRVRSALKIMRKSIKDRTITKE